MKLSVKLKTKIHNKKNFARQKIDFVSTLSADKHSFSVIHCPITITCTDKIDQLSMSQKAADVDRPCEPSFQ